MYGTVSTVVMMYSSYSYIMYIMYKTTKLKVLHIASHIIPYTYVHACIRMYIHSYVATCMYLFCRPTHFNVYWPLL